MVQKAVEMGVGALRPVFTRRTQSTRVNLERMRANVIEAAEQCGILSIPPVLAEQDLGKALSALEPDRLLIFCDEDAPAGSPVDSLSRARNNKAKFAVIVGPEGGFTDEEGTLVAAREGCIRVCWGPIPACWIRRRFRAGIVQSTLRSGADPPSDDDRSVISSDNSLAIS